MKIEHPPPHLRLVPPPDRTPGRDLIEEALDAAQSIRVGLLDIDTARKLDVAIRNLTIANRKGIKCAS